MSGLLEKLMNLDDAAASIVATYFRRHPEKNSVKVEALDTWATAIWLWRVRARRFERCVALERALAPVRERRILAEVRQCARDRISWNANCRRPGEELLGVAGPEFADRMAAIDPALARKIRAAILDEERLFRGPRGI